MKRKYNLVGVDGNAYSLMGYTQGAMRETGFSKDEINKVMTDAKSKDYNNLIVVLDRAIQDCNKRLRKGVNS